MKLSVDRSLEGVSCDVLGIGISNRPLIRLLRSLGADVSAYDKKTREALGGELDALVALGVRVFCEQMPPERLEGEVIFRSPGIRPDLPCIKEALARGAILSSEMELFCRTCPAPLFGITGSDGKTTTTTLTHLFLATEHEKKKKGRAYVGGNIGTPLLPSLPDMTPEDSVVVELSSFQLMTLHQKFFRAAITNLSPNHLNWHTDMEEYVSAKENLLENCDTAVLNADNALTMALAHKRGRDLILFSSTKTSFSEIVPPSFENTLALFVRDGRILCSDGDTEIVLLSLSDILLPGRHNVENYMTAMAMTYGLVSSETVREIARSFRGVPHRLELVRTLDGVAYYNSSIDSSPTRTIAALSAIPYPPVIICGGYDKNLTYEALAEELCHKARAVVLTGQSAKKIKDALLACPLFDPATLPLYEEPRFADAVLRARDVAKEGEAVLLSPAAASFDAFANFEERGNTFRSLVESFPEAKN